MNTLFLGLRLFFFDWRDGAAAAARSQVLPSGVMNCVVGPLLVSRDSLLSSWIGHLISHSLLSMSERSGKRRGVLQP